MLVPVKLNVPEEILPKLIDGSYSISEAVVRDNQNGRYVEFTEILPEENNSNSSQKSHLSNAAWFGLGVGAAILVGGIIYIITKSKKEESEIIIPECVSRFKSDLREYLTEAQNGQISIETIDKLLMDLAEIEATHDDSISIDLSPKEMTLLLGQIYDFTKRLATANGFITDEIEEPKGNNLVAFRKYLLLQKDIYSVA